MLLTSLSPAESAFLGSNSPTENMKRPRLWRGDFSIGEAKDEKIAPCNESGEASGLMHLTRKSWAGISSDEETDGKIAATRRTSQVCALQGQCVKLSNDIIYYDMMPRAEPSDSIESSCCLACLFRCRSTLKIRCRLKLFDLITHRCVSWSCLIDMCCI